ncbi:MAG: tyrosine-protein phosphatase [Actinomycetota bacterium]|nr:tyrosine-protein phosphatase [Actinomycetota bacterium]
MPKRQLVWDGCVNVRDLGGHPADDGRETRFGAVVRADNVRRLSDDGWRQLVEHGVRRIVDLRFQAELDDDPPCDVPVEVVHVPLLGERERAREVDELAKHIDEPVAWRSTIYLEFLERFPANFARAVAAVARAPAGTVLIHCAGGVDRTGLVAALLLRVAGVGVETIAADYAESEQNWAPFVDAWIEEAEDDEERRHRRLLALMPAEAMLVVLEELEARHGSTRSYLLKAGLEEADLVDVRARLLR